MSRFRRILHASDFSPASRAAGRRAIELARQDRATLIIVHVYPSPLPAVGDEGYRARRRYTALLASARADAGRQLDRLVERAVRTGVRARGLLLEGLPPGRLVEAARSTRADLLVMGAPRRTGLGQLLLGSVASRVLARAPCPVLTVRERSARRRAIGRS